MQFPGHVVEGALSTCPSQILLAARDPQYDYWMGGRRVGYTNFGCGIMVVDPETGELSETTKEDTEVHRQERYFGRFSRALTLPTAVAGDKVKAAYKDGILTVTLPKAEEAKPKQITVSE